MSWTAYLVNQDLARLGYLRVYSNEKFPPTSTNYMAAEADAGSDTLTVETETDYEARDLLLINPGGATEEIVRVKELDGGLGLDFTWTLFEPLAYAHLANEFIEKIRDVLEQRFAGRSQEQRLGLSASARAQTELDIQTAVDATRTSLGI